MLCRALDATGLAGYRIALGDASLYPALLDDLRRARGRRASLLAALGTRDFVGLERELATARVCDDRAAAACPSAAAAPRSSTGSPAARPTACARSWPTLPDAVARAGRLRPRPRARPRLLHGRGLRRARPGARRAARRRRALRRPARRASAATCRPSASRCGVDRLHLALAGEERRHDPRSGPPRRIAVPRGALLRRHARPARRASASTPPRSAPTTASCSSRTSASSRCARRTCRPTSRPAPPTSASPARTC